MITVYGVPGWGSTISELMLSLADIPYEVVDVEGFDQPGPARERLRQINPLCQVPTLRLADGSIMTETAAIALMILDQRPDLAPAPGTPQRPQFQRLLVWLVANVYYLYLCRLPGTLGARRRGAAGGELSPVPEKSLSLVRTAAGRRAVGAGRVGNVAGLLYRGDVPLGTPPGVV
ncbi:glutathione S-transferase%2C theta [Klebsiella pneumoniae]|nr:glutathione S-transferase%2C theta [Klebsiella pneumoniae]